MDQIKNSLTKNKKAIFYLILVFSIMSANTSVIFTKNALSYEVSPLAIGFIRLFFTALIVMPFALYKEKGHIKTLKKRHIFTCIASGTLLAIHFFCYFSSLIYTNAFISTITGAIQPIIISIISYFVFREKLSKRNLIGMTIAILGIFYIGYAAMDSVSNSSFTGFVYSMFTAVFFSFYLLIARYGMKFIKQYTYLGLLFSSCCVVLLMAVIVTKTPIFNYPYEVYLNCFLLCVCCTILGHAILNVAVKYISATEVSIISLIGPIFATIYDYVFFSQKVTISQLIGGIIIVIGVLLFLNPMKKHKEI